MDNFCFHCCKYYTEPRDPRSVVSTSLRPGPPLTTQIFERGEAMKITDARFFPEDGNHELEIKFEDGDHEEASSKMTVIIDGETVKVVKLKENSVGNAGCVVNGREVKFEWDVGTFSAKVYFSYAGKDRIGILGIPPSS